MATLNTLVTFSGTNGVHPQAALAFDPNGNLFGTARFGGANNDGIVFELAKTGTGFSQSSTIVSFNGADGAFPQASISFDPAGNLFSTTTAGGAGLVGTAFEVTKNSTGYANTPTTLVSFDGTNGSGPVSGLKADSTGNLFGTTSTGGTVFEIAKTGTGSGYASTPITLASFAAFVSSPYDTPVFDAAGNLFGTTFNGGANSSGSVFEIPKTSNGFGTLITLADLSGFTQTGVMIDGNGNLFGTTEFGGVNGDGSVFEIPMTASGYGALITLASFNGANGSNIGSGVIADAAGNLYGTTFNGGPSDNGTVFQIAKTSVGFNSTPITLFSFDGSDGANPSSNLIADANGDLFGTTSNGGANGDGIAYELTNTGFVTPGQTITKGNGDFTLDIGSNSTVTLGNGNDTITGGQNNKLTIGNGNQSITLSGGNNTIKLGQGDSTISVGNSSNTISLGRGNDTVHGGTGDTINITSGSLNISGTNEIVFLSPSNATVNDFATGLKLKIGPTAGKDTLTHFASDLSTGVIDLLGGIGGYMSAVAVVSALKSDGHGGTLLTFGSNASSLDFAGVAPSQLHASNFQIG